MKFLLERKLYGADGIFGELRCVESAGQSERQGASYGEEEAPFDCYTLEHAYQSGEAWVPKLAPGIYTCRKGLHRLEGMTHDFEAWEFQNVPDFEGAQVSGILLHVGNWNKDSEGCVLVGQVWQVHKAMLLNSERAFQKLMAATSGVDEITVEVRG